MYQVCFSAGKDSAYMAYLLKEKGYNMHLHYVTVPDVDFPSQLEYVKFFADQIEAPLTIWKHPIKTWDSQFYKISERGKRKGKLWGFPKVVNPCWANRDLKLPMFDQIYDLDGVKCIGFAWDEKHRAEAKMFQNDSYKFPLIEWNITEKTCRRELEKLGLLNPLYEHFERLGCFCCPKQNKLAMRNLYKFYPDLWKRLIKYCNDSPHEFSINYADPRILQREFEQQTDITEVLAIA